MGIAIRIGGLAIGSGQGSLSPPAPWDGTLTDGTETWRIIADDSRRRAFQHTLTATGFAGTEGVDYYTPESEVA